jgi:CheY-like chemotaxis protein
MDMRMPVMDSCQAIREIKAKERLRVGGVTPPAPLEKIRELTRTNAE